MAPSKPRSKAWMPAAYGVAEVDALKAMARGEATAAQQGAALVWIVKTVCDADGEAFRSDGDGGERETAYALGRMSVGREIRKLIEMPPAVVAKMREKNA